MNDQEVFRLLMETNPVPDGDGATPARHTTDEGSASMTTDTRTRGGGQGDLATDSRRKGAWLVAAAITAVAFIAGAALWAVSSGGDDAADQPGVATVVAAYDAINNGDLDTFYGHLTERAAERDDREFRALSADLNERIEVVEPCREIAASPTSGLDRVQCRVSVTNDFFQPAGIFIDVTDTFVIAEDGRIDVLVHQLDDRSSADDYAGAFWLWMSNRHPDVFGAAWDAVGPDAWQPENTPAFSYPDDMLSVLPFIDEFLDQSLRYPLTGSGG